MTDVNLRDVEEHYDITIAPKKIESADDAKLRRFKDKYLFVATLLAIAMVFIVCACFILLKPDSTYTGIAMNGVFGLTMLMAGYYVRGKTH
jgi:hypothetical protein